MSDGHDGMPEDPNPNPFMRFDVEEILALAENLMVMFKALVAAGFTESQALTLLATWLSKTGS